MTKVRIEPGICGFTAIAEAESAEHFTVHADVVVSPQFFAWVCGFGAQAVITGPSEVVEQMKAHVDAIAALYK